MLCCTLCVCLCMCMLCKSENLCFLNLYSVHPERILDLSQQIKSPQMRNETPLKL